MRIAVRNVSSAVFSSRSNTTGNKAGTNLGVGGNFVLDSALGSLIEKEKLVSISAIVTLELEKSVGKWQT